MHAETSPHCEHCARPAPGPGSLPLTGLFALATFYTFYLARELVLLVVVALLLNLLLGPLVGALRRLRIPEPAGAALVLLVLGALVAFGVYALAAPASEWMDRLPRETRRLQARLQDVLQPVKDLRDAAQQVEKLADFSADPKSREVTLKTPGLASALADVTQSTLSWGGMLLVLLYFLLSSGDLFARKLIKVLPRVEDKQRAASITSEIEKRLSRMLLTSALLNLGFGLVSGLLLWILAVPNPALFGVMIACLGFIPYLGPAIGLGVISLVSLLAFRSLSWAIVPPMSLACLYVLQGNLVGPLVLGRSLSLNPVVIFLGLILWSWMWGVLGAILSVPILVTVKVICDHSERLSAFGEFLSS